MLQGFINIMERMLHFHGRVGCTEPVDLQVLIKIVHGLAVCDLKHFNGRSGIAALGLRAAKHENLCKFGMCGQLLECHHESLMSL